MNIMDKTSNRNDDTAATPELPREKFERLMSEGRYEEAEEYLRMLEMLGKLDEETT